MQLSESDDLPFKSVLNALPQQLCVLDKKGVIVWVNNAWIQFSLDNGGDISNVGLGTNYLDIYQQSASQDQSQASEEVDGIRSVIENRIPSFSFEYPCHSAGKKRWFMMEIKQLNFNDQRYFVTIHQDITKRKIAEEEVQNLAVVDSLTSLSNRRHFDDFLNQEWRRAERLNLPVSLALIDIDFFKQFNDNYGHVAGDEALKKVGLALQTFGGRPGDLVARYGGEEFSVILGETELAGAEKIASEIRAAIFDLNIPHGFALPHARITASLGVASVYPSQGLTAQQLVKTADKALYDAKKSGRNCISVIRPTEQQLRQNPTAMQESA